MFVLYLTILCSTYFTIIQAAYGPYGTVFQVSTLDSLMNIAL
jgi:hypothetical protein